MNKQLEKFLLTIWFIFVILVFFGLIWDFYQDIKREKELLKSFEESIEFISNNCN